MKTAIADPKRNNPKTSTRRSADNPSSRRYVPIGEWKAKVTLESHGENRPEKIRKVKVNEIKRIECEGLNEIYDELLAGKEVRICNQRFGEAIRLYPCLNSDYSEMFAAAQTIGEFRKSLKDVKFKMVHCGMDVDPKEALKDKEFRKQAIAEKRQKRVNVTPDTIVSCPECGTEFRVGKSLA